MEIKERPTVMVLGTFHMRSSKDVVNHNLKDGLGEKTQKEILEVVDRLLKFKPTKVAVEVDHKEEEQLNENYWKYLDGEFKLDLDEVHQIGFRIASTMAHRNIYAIDWRESIGQRGCGEVIEWAKENQNDMYKILNEKYISRLKEEVNMMEDMTILEKYQFCNDPNKEMIDHEMYIGGIGRVGNPEEHVGIDWLRWWYQRNLTMYANISYLATSKEERILFIVGSGHLHLLNQFLRESNSFYVESAMKYLES